MRIWTSVKSLPYLFDICHKLCAVIEQNYVIYIIHTDTQVQYSFLNGVHLDYRRIHALCSLGREEWLMMSGSGWVGSVPMSIFARTYIGGSRESSTAGIY